jgi:AraC-like DNA-binding protein
MPEDLTPVAAKALREVVADLVLNIEARLADECRLRNVAQAVTSIKLSSDTALRVAFGQYVNSLSARAADLNYTGEFDNRCAMALQIIRRKYLDPRLSVSELSELVHLSRWHLERLLKRQTGHSFSAHLHNVRMAAAIQLMRDPCLSIKEVAVRVGYSSSTVFGRHFKRRFGVAPSTWRKRN